jgi:hypothetical protein
VLLCYLHQIIVLNILVYVRKPTGRSALLLSLRPHWQALRTVYASENIDGVLQH